MLRNHFRWLETADDTRLLGFAFRAGPASRSVVLRCPTDVFWRSSIIRTPSTCFSQFHPSSGWRRTRGLVTRPFCRLLCFSPGSHC